MRRAVEEDQVGVLISAQHVGRGFPFGGRFPGWQGKEEFDLIAGDPLGEVQQWVVHCGHLRAGRGGNFRLGFDLVRLAAHEGDRGDQEEQGVVPGRRRGGYET
jgi:hypothetical protein